MSAKALLKSGRVVDPSQDLDEVLDLLLVDGIVASRRFNWEGHLRPGRCGRHRLLWSHRVAGADRRTCAFT